MPPKTDVETIKGNRKREKNRWEDNGVSPSSYPSPTRYDESQSREYRDSDTAIWRFSKSDLTDAEIVEYLRRTAHLKPDISLAILRESDHDISSAVDTCNRLEQLPELSLLEVKVLLTASPLLYTIHVDDGEKLTASEKHLYDLLPHIPPAVIRNHYNRLGREDFLPHLECLPTLNRLKDAGLVSEGDMSPLWMRPGGGSNGGGRGSLESNACAPGATRRSNNLSIAMVGYDQKKPSITAPLDRLDLSSAYVPFDRFKATRPIVGRSLAAPKKPLSPPKRRVRSCTTLPTNRTERPPPVRSPLVVGGELSTSSARSGSSRKKRKGNLEIDMNWNLDGPRTRRSTDAMVDEERKKKEVSSARAARASGSGGSASTVPTSSVVVSKATIFDEFALRRVLEMMGVEE